MFARTRRHMLSLLLVGLAALLVWRGVLPAARVYRARAAERSEAEQLLDQRAEGLAATELWLLGLQEGDPALTARVRAGLERSPDLPGVVQMSDDDGQDVADQH